MSFVYAFDGKPNVRTYLGRYIYKEFGSKKYPTCVKFECFQLPGNYPQRDKRKPCSDAAFGITEVDALLSVALSKKVLFQTDKLHYLHCEMSSTGLGAMLKVHPNCARPAD